MDTCKRHQLFSLLLILDWNFRLFIFQPRLELFFLNTLRAYIIQTKGTCTLSRCSFGTHWSRTSLLDSSCNLDPNTSKLLWKFRRLYVGHGNFQHLAYKICEKSVQNSPKAPCCFILSDWVVHVRLHTNFRIYSGDACFWYFSGWRNQSFVQSNQ